MATPFLRSPVLIMSGWLLDRSRAKRALRSGVSVVIGAGLYRTRSARQDEDLARELRQALDAAGSGVQQHEVLDPHAGLAFQVDPGLDRERRRRRERRVERGRA